MTSETFAQAPTAAAAAPDLARIGRQAEPATRPKAAVALQAWIRALEAIKIMHEAPGTTLPGLLDTLAATHGDRPALLGGGGAALSYRGLAAAANRMARWAIAQGLVAGDAVGLLMPNCPEYVATWLGLTRAGCRVALINTNLASDGLLHSIRAAAPVRLIVAGTLVPAVLACADRLPASLGVWVHGDADGVEPDSPHQDWPHQDWPHIEPELARHRGDAIDAVERALPRPGDQALFIYTSGTTGLPKAARISHARVVEWSFWFAGMMDVGPDDRLYDCLPLYHSTGGVVAIGAMLVRGGSVLLRARFSASRFWDDVVDGGCTIFQYIGELCRYLTTSPPHPRERAHRLRLACGNGLQGDVWPVFEHRFAIPRILEFYAATEGSVSLYNCEGRPGAIGRVPPFLAQRFPVALVRLDPASETPQRDAEGRCIGCRPDQVGEAIGQVLATAGAPARQFDGYTDAAASAAKLLHDVFAPGDRWFRTGDLMRKDAAGYYVFVDRIGDSFRWKGENVATTEVAAVLRGCPGVTDAVVYGVTVPGHEGRAGMTAITTDDGFDPATLWAHLVARLPDYAQPLFLRRCVRLDTTGTFKLTRARLVQDGYDAVVDDAGPDAATAGPDPVWFNDRTAGRFVACDPALVQAINHGARRL